MLNDESLPLSESYSGGVLGGLSVTNGYDSDERRTALWASGYGSTVTSYGYDNASRLSSAGDGTYSGNYSYLANSPFVGQIAYKQSGTAQMTTTKNYDFLNRLSSIGSVPAASGQTPVSFGYYYNAANQRTESVLADSSRWNFAYDALGQVLTGRRLWSDGTPVAGEQFEYSFDTIGNRTSTGTGGDTSGANLRSASYTNNSVNEITSRSVPAGFDVTGAAIATATVTVNGQAADRKGEFYHSQVAVTNTSVLFDSVAAVATGVGGYVATTNTGHYFVAQTPESYSYDTDGNLLSDGHWSYTWDAEGRRIQKSVSYWSGSAYTNSYTRRFLYDGWNLVAELDGSNNLIRSYIWGTDLSGSMQGAGGVGGLLVVKPVSADPLFVAYDGNGNVSGLERV